MLPCQHQFLESEVAAAMWVNEELDSEGHLLYLDKAVSVSALIEIENDFDYDPTHNELNRRLIHNA